MFNNNNITLYLHGLYLPGLFLLTVSLGCITLCSTVLIRFMFMDSTSIFTGIISLCCTTVIGMIERIPLAVAALTHHVDLIDYNYYHI